MYHRATPAGWRHNRKTNMQSKRLYTIMMLAAIGAASVVSAQSEHWTEARKAIHHDINLCGSNYTAYPDPTQPLTPAPKGYEPFYLSGYARHGSRWLCGDGQYRDVIEPLKRASQQGKLTAEGKALLQSVEDFYQGAKGRIGDLTTKGEDQHHRIGRRMAQNFPQIFTAKNSRVDARSTVVIRCILSMEAECEELTRHFAGLTVHNDVSQIYQWYLAPNTPDYVREAEKGRNGLESKWRKELVHPDRFAARLFNDATYLRDSVNSERLMRRTFDVCCNMQSHYGAPNLWSYFTEDEAYDLWTLYNRRHYAEFGASAYTQGKAPFKVEALLRNFLSTADTIVSRKDYHGATLRFGHEVFLMPLAALMELGHVGERVENVDTLDRVWANSTIFPMAGNIQLIFYRPKKGRQGDILVKALLQEREMTLPVAPVQFPYYRWDDLKAYYTHKLDHARD